MEMKRNEKTRNRSLKSSLVFAFFMLILFAAGTHPVFAQTKTTAQTAPDFTLKLLDGTEVTLSKLRDRPVVINFWATWCGYCVKEFPDFQELWEEYDGKIHILAVNVGETKKVIEDFLKKTPYTFPIVMDTAYKASTAYRVSGIPVTYIIGKDGSIIFSRVGMMSKKDMISAVEDALKK